MVVSKLSRWGKRIFGATVVGIVLVVALTEVAYAQVLSYDQYATQGRTWLASLERGAPAGRVEVMSDVSINRFELFAGSLVDHQLYFFIYDINNDSWLYWSNGTPLNGSQYFQWKSSESFPAITLKAGGAYYIGAIPQQGAAITPYQDLWWPFTPRTSVAEYYEGDLKLVAQNAVVKNHLNPTIAGTASAIFPLRLYEELAVVTDSLPDGVQDQSYGPIQLEMNAEKSSLSRTWSAVAAPAGLVLSSDGVLSGTMPAQPGEHAVEVEVRIEQESGVVATARKTLEFKVPELQPPPPPSPPPQPPVTDAHHVPTLGGVGVGALMGLVLLVGLRERRRARS